MSKFSQAVGKQSMQPPPAASGAGKDHSLLEHLTSDSARQTKLYGAIASGLFGSVPE